MSFDERIADRKDDVQTALENLMVEYQERIEKFEDKLQDLFDWEDKWEVFKSKPEELSREELGELFNHYERRALEISAHLQGAGKDAMQ